MVPLVLPARTHDLPALGDLSVEVWLAERCLPWARTRSTEVSWDPIEPDVRAGPQPFVGQRVLVLNEIPPLLSDVLPEFALELENGLSALQEGSLAEQVQFLRLVRGCGCEDEFCASFYTSPRPEGGWDGEFHNVVVSFGETGTVILDVVDGTIRFVEVLDRPDVRSVVAKPDIPR